MTSILLVGRLLLAAVFAVGGLAKLADLAGSRQAMRGFGVPERLATPLGTVLPIAELAVAVALVPGVSARWGALGALILLLLFVVGISYNLARGRTPDCHCFGQLHSSPAGWPTLARNMGLVPVAAFIVWQGPTDPGLNAVTWLSDTSPVERIALVASLLALGLWVVQGWVLVNLLGQNGRLLRRLEAIEAALAAGGAPVRGPADTSTPTSAEPGLPVGVPAPDFALPGLYGEILTLESLYAAGKPVLLVFTDPDCGPCNALLPDLGRWQRAEALTVAIVGEGTAEANRAKATKQGLNRVLLQRDREVAEAYEANGTPAAVVVLPDGTIGSALALGTDEIRALAAQTVGALAPTPPPAAPAVASAPTESANGDEPAPAPPVPQLGDPAPAFELPDLDGTPVRLADFHGHPTLVLFWNLDCGFCLQMLPKLKASEANRPEGAPRLLVVSTGAAEENRAMGLTSTVVLDQGFETGLAFGTDGTPTAVLVDAEGRIASPIASGAPAVLALVDGLDPAEAGAESNGVAASATPEVGDPAPAFELPDLDGTPVRLADFHGHPTLVLFWNLDCGFCRQMLDDLKAWEADPPEGAPKLLVVSTGDPERNRAIGLRSTVVLGQNFEVGHSFGARGTPSAVLVDAEGRIVSSLAVGAPAVLALARGEGPSPAAPGKDAAAPKLEVGDPAPAIELPDLSDQMVSLTALRGTPTLVLFWSPGCSPCTRILDDLKAWEANPPEGAPKLLVVSSGDPERNRAMGLRSTVVLDRNFAAGYAFGARGTPSAVLVDAEGRIASPVVAGGPPVLGLVGAGQGHPKPASA
jgi:peroxiredoxin/uncharacterized membrane protein YphA (DoxX/SURF4 family)